MAETESSTGGVRQYHNRFSSASLSYRQRVLRVSNVLLSVLCGAAGILVMFTFAGISQIIMAIYTTLFSLVLLLFELRISSSTFWFRQNFGFLYLVIHVDT